MISHELATGRETGFTFQKGARAADPASDAKPVGTLKIYPAHTRRKGEAEFFRGKVELFDLGLFAKDGTAAREMHARFQEMGAERDLCVRERAVARGAGASAEAELFAGRFLWRAALSDLDFEFSPQGEPSWEGLISLICRYTLIAEAAMDKGTAQTAMCLVLKGRTDIVTKVRALWPYNPECHRFVVRFEPGGEPRSQELFVLVMNEHEIGNNRSARPRGNHKVNPRGSEILNAVAAALNSEQEGEDSHEV